MNQTDPDLRDRIAEALLTTRRADYADLGVKANHREHRFDARCALCTYDVDALADAVMAELRRLPSVARSGQPETEARGPWGTRPRCTCSHAEDEHSVYGCLDDCACEWMPKRKPMDPVHILGIDADATPARSGQPETDPEAEP